MIGRYRDADRAARPEPPAATLQDVAAIAEASAAATRAGAVAPPALPGVRVPQRAATEPISDLELATANLSVGDSTHADRSARLRGRQRYVAEDRRDQAGAR